MKEYIFKPNYETISKVEGVRTIPFLEKEVGMYSATPEFVREFGGPISKELLGIVPEWYYEEGRKKGLMPNIDIRIHRLYPGDYPAYPGWHCDGEFRETYFSQPDLDRVNVSKHIICTISSHDGGVSNPEFLNEEFVAGVVAPSSDHTLWGQVHRQLAEVEKTRKLNTFIPQDGEMILFDPWTLHRVRPAHTRGWRLFFRMSLWHRPNLGNGGMLTKQEQVYKVLEGTGW